MLNPPQATDQSPGSLDLIPLYAERPLIDIKFQETVVNIKNVLCTKFCTRTTKDRKLPIYQAAKWIKETRENQQSGIASSCLNEVNKGYWEMFMMYEMKQAV